MLLRFVVENFLSISEEIDFTMFPYSRLREKRDHVYHRDHVNLLKTMAVFGANGSGKTNLVKAMAYLKEFVMFSDGKDWVGIVSPNLTMPGYAERPSAFEVEFLAGDNKHYRYELSVRAGEVVREVLSVSPDLREDKEEILFSRERRDGDTALFAHSKFRNDPEAQLRFNIYSSELLSRSGSMLKLLVDKPGYEDLGEAYDWIAERFTVFFPFSRISDLAYNIHQNDRLRSFTNYVLGLLDTGVMSVRSERLPYETFFGLDEQRQKNQLLNRLRSKSEDFVSVNAGNNLVVVKLEEDELFVYRLITEHGGDDGEVVALTPAQESDGTQRILDLLPAIMLAIKQESTVVIDEIGRSLHPNLLIKLLSIFTDHPTKGQLIFTTHEDALLSTELLRRDEVKFIVPTSERVTELHALSDYKTRNDLDLRKHYLFGRFGGTPQLFNYFPERAMANG